MKKIKIKNRAGVIKYAIVDDEDFEYLSNYTWHLDRDGYARSRSFFDKSKPKRQHLRMHRLIMDTPQGMEVDHINGEVLDNRKKNLRNCTRQENGKSVRKKAGKKFKGISKMNNKWFASIKNNGKSYGLGLFDTEVDAAKAYDIAARILFGEFAKVNFPNCGKALAKAKNS